ncbi:hypothetical protein GDO81_015171 [Engystomops pustulosus]|uniref:Uncharacterized protein n=1 Tax=Engystomops pustulosus TaxID=76066 RepID=A0AAV7AJC4_ENGPU|nr:hypothetical protein GDO81_015171 [Engystomops pustulosus]
MHFQDVRIPCICVFLIRFFYPSLSLSIEIDAFGFVGLQNVWLIFARTAHFNMNVFVIYIFFFLLFFFNIAFTFQFFIFFLILEIYLFICNPSSFILYSIRSRSSGKAVCF